MSGDVIRGGGGDPNGEPVRRLTPRVGDHVGRAESARASDGREDTKTATDRAYAGGLSELRAAGRPNTMKIESPMDHQRAG